MLKLIFYAVFEKFSDFQNHLIEFLVKTLLRATTKQKQEFDLSEAFQYILGVRMTC